MKNNLQATHHHKTAGAVVVLESTTQLARVSIPTKGDEFWVKLTDLTELVGGEVEKGKSARKRSPKERPNASANSQYRVIRAA
jgi:hypothetical protein